MSKTHLGFPRFEWIRCAVIAVAAAVLAASCGDSEESRPSAGDSERSEVDLRVAVVPQGPGGPKRVRRIECRGAAADDRRCRDLRGLRPRDLAPVARGTICTQIYGGPATARVTGRLRGERVSASFDLTDGCEIARWERNAALLGRPPGRRGTTPSGGNNNSGH